MGGYVYKQQLKKNINIKVQAKNDQKKKFHFAKVDVNMKLLLHISCLIS